MYPESDLLAISGLQHFIFCERQWALIHLEQQWEENRLTAEGTALHERVDEPDHEVRGDVRIVRALPLRSLVHGMTGRADVVEFHSHGAIIPVEYKRGKPKADRCDEVQLCAQALCLEEMTGTPIPQGYLFYGQPRRRTEVLLSDELRRLTLQTLEKMHIVFSEGKTPLTRYEKKCDNCSLIECCSPKVLSPGKNVKLWLKNQLEALNEIEP